MITFSFHMPKYVSMTHYYFCLQLASHTLFAPPFVFSVSLRKLLISPIDFGCQHVGLVFCFQAVVARMIFLIFSPHLAHLPSIHLVHCLYIILLQHWSVLQALTCILNPFHPWTIWLRDSLYFRRLDCLVFTSAFSDLLYFRLYRLFFFEPRLDSSFSCSRAPL